MALTPGILLAQCKSTWRSKLDLEYLDETSATKRMQMLQRGHAIGAKLDQFAEYAAKESLGQVHIAGFLHDEVARNSDMTFTHPSRLTNEERKRRITRAWSRLLRQPAKGKGAKQDVIQHRLVFSMSSELHAACLKAKLKPEQVLHQSMKRNMRRFQERFHLDDSISYAYGFHHDTDHLHVHVALCPRTRNGNYVGFSTPKNKIRNTSRQKDHLGFVRHCCESENRKWRELLAQRENLSLLQTQRHGERFILPPVDHSTRHKLRWNPEVLAQELTIRYCNLTALQSQLQETEREYQQARLEARAAGLFKWKTTQHLARKVRDQKRIQLKELRQRFFRLRNLYLDSWRFYQRQRPNQGYSQAHRYRQATGIRI